MNVDESWIEVSDYDDRWPNFYQVESAKIVFELGNFARSVEHFGSTSVPGLAAKPIVDILVGTTAVDLPQIVLDAFGDLSYEFLGEDGRRPGRFFWRKRAEVFVNVSVVQFEGPMWAENLLIRDFLRSHPGWANDYADAKRAAAKESPNSLLGYQDGKRGFVDRLREAARSWGASNTTR